MRFILQLFCRHEYVTQFEPGRIFQRCTKCSRETPGFEL